MSVFVELSTLYNEYTLITSFKLLYLIEIWYDILN